MRRQTLVYKAARFAACEKIEGDYLEFGVYQGHSFIQAYHALKDAFISRLNLTTGCEDEGNERRERQEIWDKMRFIAFDSFQGLPELSKEDKNTLDFKAGMYACSQEEFMETLIKNSVPIDRTVIIKGRFKDTCNQETALKHNIRKAAVVWVDGDLYSSAKTSLNFIFDLLQDETIIIFDDWFSYKGNPLMGEQKAFYEWVASKTFSKKFIYSEYQKESWKRNSFIISKK